jgi:hypothetical protein
MVHLQYDNSSLHNLAKALVAMQHGTFRKVETLAVERAPQCSMIAPDSLALMRRSSSFAWMTLYSEPYGSCNGFMTSDSPFDLPSIPKLPSVLDSEPLWQSSTPGNQVPFSLVRVHRLCKFPLQRQRCRARQDRSLARDMDHAVVLCLVLTYDGFRWRKSRRRLLRRIAP